MLPDGINLTEKWEPLGYGASNGIDGYGRAIKAFDGKVYVSGNFSSAGQVTLYKLSCF